ncbi:MAG: DUF2911 domain-containing protein [Balneolaceae bacterium]
MKNLLYSLLLIGFSAACSSTSFDPNKAAFVTLLGNDTLAVEQFEKNGNEINAKVILRSPQTTFSSYNLILDETGGIQQMTRTNFPLEEGFSGNGTVVQTVEKDGDSLKVQMETSNGSRNFTTAHAPGVLPFIDMVHWPFEIAFNHAVEAGADSTSQMLLSGNNVSNFVIAAIEGDSMTIRHPFRGVMGVRVNSAGDIMHLDAALTTRKLKVNRVPSIDIEKVGENFANSDKSGNPFGALSGAETAEFSFNDTNFKVEYGVPYKRGRELFGGIVPWGERWRTGANRATHFYTSSDLRIGDLDVPAGEYTLFTIPEPDGGTLIINKQTGQNGQSYDEERDLGRVPMEISAQEEETEAFTITVENSGSGGILKLIWGDTIFSTEFEIE